MANYEIREQNARIVALEKERDQARQQAEINEKRAAIKEIFAGFSWRSQKQRDLLASAYVSQIAKHNDGALVFNDERIETAIRADIEANYRNLLTEPDQQGTAVSKSIDYNSLNAGSTTADIHAAAKQAAAELERLMR